jgi:hypothetical protein
MADYSNIKRVVIRKPVGLRDAIEAFKILQELNQQIDVVRIMAERQVIPKIVTDHMMMQIDLKIEEAVRLAGFVNSDDMRYFATHFMNL